ATLTRTDNTPIPAGQAIDFYVGTDLVGTATTNSSGVAVLNGYDPSLLLAGQYSVQALFAGQPSWQPPLTSTSSNLLYLTVNGQAVGLTATAVSGNYGST